MSGFLGSADSSDMAERKKKVMKRQGCKKVEDAIDKERSILRGIIEHTGAMMAYFDLDFNFVVVNSAYAQGAGYPIEELIGKNHFALFPNKENQAIFEKVRETEEPVKFLDKPFEFANQPHRGVTYWDWTLSPVKSPRGKLQGLVLTLMETTERKKSEDAIKRSEIRFRSLYENSFDAVLLTMPNGVILRANPAACRMFGMTEQEIQKAGRTGILVYEERAKRAIMEREKTGKAKAELTFRRKDGSTFEGEASSSLFTDADGTIKTSMIIRDITEQKKSEEQLKENAERLNMAQKIAHIGSWEYYAKMDRAIWSKELFNIFGLEPQTYGPDTSTYVKLMHPEDREKINTTMEKLLFNAKVGDMASFDYRILRPDGSVRTLHSERIIREVDKDGKATRIMGIEQDITEQKQVEDALKESEQLYRTVFDNSQDGFQLVELICDKNGKPNDARILKVNQAFKIQSGIKVANVVGKTMKEITPNIEKYWFETYHKILKTGKSTHFENYNVDTKRYYDAYIFPYSENVVGVLFRDITEGKNLERQLQDKERMAAIGATAGMVGHDLRNPLQTIISELYLAESELMEMPEGKKKAVMKEAIQSISEQVGYMDKIVSDLQTFVKPVEPQAKIIGLKPLIVALLAQANIPDNIQTDIQIQDALTANADPQLLKRVLINLITNAIQAMPQGGELTVKAKANPEGQVQIVVEDTGEGIPEEIRPKIFTPLFTTKAKGQGFGLAVCKRVIEAQSGTINFESQEGKGTKFIVSLPAK